MQKMTIEARMSKLDHLLDEELITEGEYVAKSRALRSELTRESSEARTDRGHRPGTESNEAYQRVLQRVADLESSKAREENRQGAGAAFSLIFGAIWVAAIIWFFSSDSGSEILSALVWRGLLGG